MSRSVNFVCVESGIGGEFQNTKEFHVMRYKAEMETRDR